MLVHASWIPGTAFVAEQATEDLPGHPSTAIVGLKQGWGTTFRIPPRPATAIAPVYWFHAPIPTSVYSDGRPLFIDKAHILFKTEEEMGPYVVQIGLWDGGHSIANFGNFQESIFGGGQPGDFSTLRQKPQSSSAGYVVRAFANTFLPRTADQKRIHPQYSVTICVGVSGETQGRSLNIAFFGAGIDFVDTET